LTSNGEESLQNSRDELIKDLHFDACEIVHPRLEHDEWTKIVNIRRVRFEPVIGAPFCLNCGLRITDGTEAWVVNKKKRIHYCKECGMSQFLPVSSRLSRSKRNNKRPNPGALLPPKGKRLYSGQRRNWE